jgi:hypothetical protein
MNNPTTETDQQKALAAFHALLREILAWECFKDPKLAELIEAQRHTRQRLSALDDDGGAR